MFRNYRKEKEFFRNLDLISFETQFSLFPRLQSLLYLSFQFEPHLTEFFAPFMAINLFVSVEQKTERKTGMENKTQRFASTTKSALDIFSSHTTVFVHSIQYPACSFSSCENLRHSNFFITRTKNFQATRSHKVQ